MMHFPQPFELFLRYIYETVLERAMLNSIKY